MNKYLVEYEVIKDGQKKIETGSWETTDDQEALEDYRSFQGKCAVLSNAHTSSSRFVTIGCFRISEDGSRTKID